MDLQYLKNELDQRYKKRLPASILFRMLRVMLRTQSKEFRLLMFSMEPCRHDLGLVSGIGSLHMRNPGGMCLGPRQADWPWPCGKRLGAGGKAPELRKAAGAVGASAACGRCLARPFLVYQNPTSAVAISELKYSVTV